MQCSDDAIAPDAVDRYVADQIRDSKFVKMDATGYCPHMSHPQEMIATIAEFLSELHQNA